jgi:hypothetical protein
MRWRWAVAVTMALALSGAWLAADSEFLEQSLLLHQR